MTSRRRGGAVAATVLLALGAACGGSDAGESDDSASGEPPTPVTTDAAATTGAVTTPDASATTSAPTTSSTTTSAAPAPPSTTTTTEAPEAPAAIDGVTAPEASTVGAVLALDRPVILAHAGGDFDAPHSTMFAYTEAALAGVDVLELDVTITADGVLVVQHDATVDRLTPTTGVVRDLVYEELDALDNAHWFSGDVWVDQTLPDEAYVHRGVRTGDRPPPEGYTADDFSVATFREVAEGFPNHVLDVEIKVFDGDLATATEAAATLAAEITDLDRTDSVVVVSFSDDVIAAFRGFAPDVATSPALGALLSWFLGDPSQLTPQDVVFQAPPFFDGAEVLTADTITRAADDGYPVWAYMDDTSTQENAEFYRLLVDRGVDGLIVSRPAEGVAAVS